MNAANPAARPADTFSQFWNRSFHVLISGFLLFDVDRPANPFITGQGRDVFPRSQSLWRSLQRFTHISRQFMNDAARDSIFRHEPILAHQALPKRLFIWNNRFTMAKILLVEDDENLVKSYVFLLTTEGHAVEQAENGDWGIEKVKSFQPDLVLLDMLMPASNGLDFLRKFPETGSKAKVIVMSNMETIQTELEAAQLGAERFILKSSLSPHELAQLVKNEVRA